MKHLSSIVFVLSLCSCSPEKDIQNPNFTPLVLSEDFSSNTVDGADLNVMHWTNFAQTGTIKWKQGLFYSDKYAEFSGYLSGEPSNIGWLISPPIDMDNSKNEKIVFQVAQAYVATSANSLDFLVATNFDGTNVTAANWEKLAFTLPPLEYENNFDFFDSGVIDLSSYNGTIHFAFRVKSSGTNSALDGTYEIDNVRIFQQE